jgi:hypothetical protein
MKAGISNIWLLGMIIVFIFLFSCYVIISVNYSKSFKMKNEVLSIIERGKGMTAGPGGLGNSVEAAGTKKTSAFGLGQVTTNVPTLQTIAIYLRGNAYTAKGHCQPENDHEKWYGVTSLDTVSIEPVEANKDYYYCFAKFKYGTRQTSTEKKYINYYYKVILFYKMDFPVLKDWLSVKVEGETAAIMDVQDGARGWICNGEAGGTC